MIWKKYVELKKNYERVVSDNNDLIIRFRHKSGQLDTMKAREYDKIRDLLDEIKVKDKFLDTMEGSILADINSNEMNILPVNSEGHIITDQHISTFSQIIENFVNRLDMDERKEMHELLEDFFYKHCKDELMIRDWNLCFKSIIRPPKRKK